MSGAPRPILIVEDDQSLRSSLIGALEGEDFTCMGVGTVREATFKLKNQKFACVVLDLKLGEESGVEVATFMRTRKEIPNHLTPVLVVSGSFEPEVMKSLAGKVQGAMVKPLDLAALKEKLKKISGG